MILSIRTKLTLHSHSINEIPIGDGRGKQDVDFASSCKVWEALDSSVAGDGPALQNPALLPTPADLNHLFG